MKNVFIIVLAAVLVLPFAGDLFAQAGEATLAATAMTTSFNNYINSPMANNYDLGAASGNLYNDSFSDKLGTGIINAATAWTDIPRHVAEVTEEENAVSGMTLGLGSGIISGIGRGFSAAYDMATFGLPPYDKPMVKPEYKTDDPNKELKIDILRW